MRTEEIADVLGQARDHDRSAMCGDEMRGPVRRNCTGWRYGGDRGSAA
jgi:hypothetical protein